MHGLVNRSIQCFVRDMYGHKTWAAVVEPLGPDFEDFESMSLYEDEVTTTILKEVSTQLGKPTDTVLEDLGTYLVSHPSTSAIRRLLRFGGETFREFLFTLDDLPDRARAAVLELELPQMELREHPEGRFSLTVTGEPKGFAHVMLGILRAMADDYGALVFIEHEGLRGGAEVLEVQLLDSAFASGNSFSLTPIDHRDAQTQPDEAVAQM